MEKEKENNNAQQQQRRNRDPFGAYAASLPDGWKVHCGPRLKFCLRPGGIRFREVADLFTVTWSYGTMVQTKTMDSFLGKTNLCNLALRLGIFQVKDFFRDSPGR